MVSHFLLFFNYESFPKKLWIDDDEEDDDFQNLAKPGPSTSTAKQNPSPAESANQSCSQSSDTNVISDYCPNKRNLKPIVFR